MGGFGSRLFCTTCEISVVAFDSSRAWPSPGFQTREKERVHPLSGGGSPRHFPPSSGMGGGVTPGWAQGGGSTSRGSGCARSSRTGRRSSPRRTGTGPSRASSRPRCRKRCLGIVNPSGALQPARVFSGPFCIQNNFLCVDNWLFTSIGNRTQAVARRQCQCDGLVRGDLPSPAASRAPVWPQKIHKRSDATCSDMQTRCLLLL